MKKLLFLSFVLSLVLLWACPMITSNSIDKGSYKFPRWLKGQWKATTGKDSGHIYMIEGKQGVQGCATATGISDVDGKPTGDAPYQLILSDVGGQLFLNIYNVGDDESPAGWMLYRLRKTNDSQFTLDGVEEDAIDQKASSEDIKKYLLANQSKDIYDKREEMSFAKVK